MDTAHKDEKQVLSPGELLKHWQGHRALTRRVIEAFPEDQFFNYSIGGMRPFAGMVSEFLAMGGPGTREMVTGEVSQFDEEIAGGSTKADFLKKWDLATAEINEFYAQIPAEKFSENIKLFGQYEGTVLSSLLYFIDNEIHHRGQGYVYLRSLGIEPPAFWDR